MAKYSGKILVADIDGTLISKGSVYTLSMELIERVRAGREEGKLFTPASGRDKVFQNDLRRRIIGQGMPIKFGEAILYEDVGLEFQGSDVHSKIYGGIPSDRLGLIRNLYDQHPELFKGLVPLPNNHFTVRHSWVTEEFSRNEPTNADVLNKRQGPIKSLIESMFPYVDGVEVVRSADAIDVVAKGANKIIAFGAYTTALRAMKISPKGILCIGDAQNDEYMLMNAVEAGGRAAFVGPSEEIRARLNGIDRIYLSEKHGPEGTLEVLRKFF
jgi:hydroxymethylpyrimidine pyrophosphatase-like HAD family hydrolase